MDIMKESTTFREEIEKINRILSDGTALSKKQRKDLKHQHRVLKRQFKALLKKL